MYGFWFVASRRPGLGCSSHRHEQAHPRGGEDHVDGADPEVESHGRSRYHRYLPPFLDGRDPEAESRVGHESHDHGPQAGEKRQDQRRLLPVFVQHGQDEHEDESRYPEGHIGGARPGESPGFETHIGGALHGRRAGDRLAQSHAVAERVAAQPVLLLDGQLLDVGDHGRPAERGHAQTKEREEDRQRGWRGGTRDRRLTDILLPQCRRVKCPGEPATLQRVQRRLW